jgi:hypothetical protein
VELALVVASAHDLGMLVEPMQALPVAGVERQLEVRATPRQAILDRSQKMIDPLPRHGGNGERRGLPRLLLLGECGSRVGVEQIHLVPRLDDAIGVIRDANLVQNRLDITGLRVAVGVGNVAHMHNDIGCATSSSVARKAEMSVVGKSEMNPTVSERIAEPP